MVGKNEKWCPDWSLNRWAKSKERNRTTFWMDTQRTGKSLWDSEIIFTADFSSNDHLAFGYLWPDNVAFILYFNRLSTGGIFMEKNWPIHFTILLTLFYPYTFSPLLLPSRFSQNRPLWSTITSIYPIFSYCVTPWACVYGHCIMDALLEGPLPMWEKAKRSASIPGQ